MSLLERSRSYNDLAELAKNDPSELSRVESDARSTRNTDGALTATLGVVESGVLVSPLPPTLKVIVGAIIGVAALVTGERVIASHTTVRRSQLARSDADPQEIRESKTQPTGGPRWRRRRAQKIS